MIDGHNDLPWALHEQFGSDLDATDLAKGVPCLHTDLPRLREGGVTGQFWSVYVPSSLHGSAAVEATRRQIDLVHRLVARYPDDLALATTVAQLEQARRAGRIASLIGMEGGHSIDESIDVLHEMYERGARYLTLTHNDNVPWADSATDVAALGGLSSFGTEVVREMNRIGMLVDLSHVSTDVMRQALAVTGRPVMFSHSSARAICDVARNVPDDVLTQLSVNGGICMVTFVADFVSPAVARWFADMTSEFRERGGGDTSTMTKFAKAHASENPPPRATVEDVVLHFNHIRDIAGVDHVGVGGDFDGTMLLPLELDDVAAYPRLFEALGQAGWSQQDLEKVRATNVLRVLHDAEVGAAI